MSTIYHYCSIESFKKIIQNKTLKFTDIIKSNDKAEIVYLWEKYYKYINDTSKNNAATSALKYEIRNQLEQTVFLVLCFTKEPDALHMWNRYADSGVCIGFDYDVLKKWSRKICYYNPLSGQLQNGATCTELMEVEYYDCQNIEEYVAHQCQGVEFVTDAFQKVFLKAPFVKSDFWKMEEEIRMVIKIFMFNTDSNILEYVDNEHFSKVDVKLESGANKNFPHVIYATIPFPDTMLTSITIGPNCGLTENDIRQILYINGLGNASININRSRGSSR